MKGAGEKWSWKHICTSHVSQEELQRGGRGYREEGGVTDRKEELQRGRSRRVEHVNTASHPSVSPLWKKVTLNEI